MKTSAACTGAVLAGGACTGTSEKETVQPTTELDIKGYVDEPAKRIPVIDSADVIILVSGRCFGFDKDLTYDAREIGTCLVTGQAAGTAAALSSVFRTSVQDVDVKLLQQKLTEQGAKLR